MKSRFNSKSFNEVNSVRTDVRFSVPTSVMLLKYKSKPSDFKDEAWVFNADERTYAPSKPSLLAYKLRCKSFNYFNWDK